MFQYFDKMNVHLNQEESLSLHQLLLSPCMHRAHVTFYTHSTECRESIRLQCVKSKIASFRNESISQFYVRAIS